MEYALYRICYRGHRKLEAFVNMCAFREEAEVFTKKLVHAPAGGRMLFPVERNLRRGIV